MVLRYGALIPLVARTDDGWHHYVLTFARHSFMETAIVAINVSSETAEFWPDLTELTKVFESNSNSIIMV
jgi:hypothetical protein